MYQELKVHKVKKNAIEVKVKEVAQKDGRKVWIVRPEFVVSTFLFFFFPWVFGGEVSGRMADAGYFFKGIAACAYWRCVVDVWGLSARM